MDEKTKQFVRDLVERCGGNRETAARFMRDALRIGSLRACRQAIQQALDEKR